MKRSYAEELSELPATYAAVTAFVSGLHYPSHGPMIFVGSGGAVPIARLAAELHQRASGHPAVAMTPLEVLGSRLRPGSPLTIITASGKHPDVATVVDAARRLDYRPIQAVTCRPVVDLPPALAEDDIDVVSVPSPLDGFLATNSSLALATALCVGYGHELPEVLPAFGDRDLPVVRDRVLALFGPGHGSVAADFETRMAETGLAAVQVADLRNFAHGRHVGLARSLPLTSVVVFEAAGYAQLTQRTLALLPEETDVVRVSTPLPYPASVLDLMVRSMQLVGVAGAAAGVDPGRPGVAEFGRRLYRLPIRRLLPSTASSVLDRKVAAAGMGLGVRPVYEAALADWRAGIAAQEFAAVVMDYDGTCCSTKGRFAPPPAEVRAGVVRLLRAGVRVGFASGRGRSLDEQLRAMVPEELWRLVHVGLYNGSVRYTLGEDFADQDGCDGDLAEIAHRLRDFGIRLRVTERRSQVTVEAAEGSPVAGAELLGAVQAALARPPKLACKAFASGHSADVIASEATKAAMVTWLADVTGASVLAVGDQGQVGGNDFELLAATPWSLSVDACSADPSRCWNLGAGGHAGPPLLAEYMDALVGGDGAVTFRWR